MGRQKIEVRTGLDERAGVVLVGGRVVVDEATGKPIPRTRHASVRFVTAPEPPEPEPVPADRWTPPLVAARLKRMAGVFRRDRVSDIWPSGYRSCMPEPILDRNRDYAPDMLAPRELPSGTDIEMARRTFERILRLFVEDEAAGAIIWAMANGKSFQDCADELNARLRRRDITRFDVRNKWANKVGPEIVRLFNADALAIEREDVARAERRSFHRKI